VVMLGMHPDAQRRLLGRMDEKGLEPNVATWATHIHALLDHDQLDEAQEVLERMVQGGINPFANPRLTVLLEKINSKRGESRGSQT